MNLVTVREHARLTTGPVPQGNLDVASVSPSVFDWLCREAQRHTAGGARLVQVEDRQWLRVDNYVGVLEAPCGTRIEILPKHVAGPTDVESARKVLMRMLRYGLHLPVRDTGPTALQTFSAPVSEWIIGQFLLELDQLVRRGLRFDYRLVDEEVRFLRGRLRVAEQIRQPVGRRDCFQVEHQVFQPHRPENRLIASALAKVAGLTRDPKHWRLSHELEHQLAEVDRSSDIPGDFRKWSRDRLMSHYRSIRPWCELILGDQNPTSVVGNWVGRSLLFPMERVFESFVEACLRRGLPAGARLRAQATQRYLAHQDGRAVFQLRPDFLIEHEGSTWVVDAKWKLIDSSDVLNNYGIRSSDAYQLFAYGNRYRAGNGRVMLVFPRTADFSRALHPFDMGENLWLDVVPLDLDTGELSEESLIAKA